MLVIRKVTVKKMPRQEAEKLVSISATSVLVTETSKQVKSKAVERSKLQQVLYVHYSALFDEFFIEILIDSGSKVNIIQLSVGKKLGFRIYKIDVGVKKSDGSRLETFEIVITLLQVDDKDKKFYFFEETFSLADISMIIAFGMLFLILSNVKVNFNN